MEVHLVLAGLLLLSRKKPDPEPGVIARQQRDAVLGVVGRLLAQDAGPETRQKERIVRIETEREEVTRHPAPHLRPADSQPQTGHVLRAHEEAPTLCGRDGHAKRISERAALGPTERSRSRGPEREEA